MIKTKLVMEWLLPLIEVSVAIRKTARTASSISAKSTPCALNCDPADFTKLSGIMGVAMNLEQLARPCKVFCEDMILPRSKAVNTEETLATESGHQPSHTMFCGRVNGRALGIDVPHDAGDQNEAAVMHYLGLVVKIPTCKLRGIYDSK